jgi:hypothetical protein
MAHYKLYFMDFHGHIARAEDCEYTSDAAAIAAVMAAHPGAHMELWMGARLVRILMSRRDMSRRDTDLDCRQNIWPDAAGGADGIANGLNHK